VSQQTLQLAVNEIMVDGHKRMLVDGSTTWSYAEYRRSSRTVFVSLYYKQMWMTDLRKQKAGYVERFGEKRRFLDLACVVEAYKDTYKVAWIERHNAKQSIVHWYQFGPSTATVMVALTREEMDMLESTACANGYDGAASLATKAVRALLAGRVPY